MARSCFSSVSAQEIISMRLPAVATASFWPGLVVVSQGDITWMWCLCHPIVPVTCFPPQLRMASPLAASPCRDAGCSRDPVPMPPSSLLWGWGHQWWQCPTMDALLAWAKGDLIPTSAAKRQAGLSLHGESEPGVWAKAGWGGLQEALREQRSCESKPLKDPWRC